MPKFKWLLLYIKGKNIFFWIHHNTKYMSILICQFNFIFNLEIDKNINIIFLKID